MLPAMLTVSSRVRMLLLSGKEFARSAEAAQDVGSSLGWEDPLEEGMSAHSSIPAWRIPWTEHPGKLQTIALQRVECD